MYRLEGLPQNAGQGAAPIGRYLVLQELGHGAEGTVWLAKDPLLERQVAIKTINRSQIQHSSRLLAEARLVSRLHHPNIVTLFDVVESEGAIALVFEFVEGESLEHRIHRAGSIPAKTAVELAIQVLQGLTVAHAQGIIHRDIKPSNILVDSAGIARLADFGVATRLEAQNGEIVGSHAYVAPEFLRGEKAGVNADVFSMGVLLYTMLTGATPVSGEGIFEIWYKMTHEKLMPPSQKNPAIDERLDDLVLKALFRQPGERFASAEEFAGALTRWLTEGQDLHAADPAQGDAVLEFLMRRMRLTSDFPALTQSIGAISRITQKGNENIHALAQAILRDFALSNKLLRLVNSASYAQFRGNISTVSRATMILGVNAIRHLALSLMLLDHLQNRSQAQRLREEILCSFMIGLFARKLAPKLGQHETEVAFVCGTFHKLGRMLATYYFFDESLAVRKRLSHEPEAEASRHVLGVSYTELGLAVARLWNLPEDIVFSLEAWDMPVLKTPKTEAERLRTIAELACALFESVYSTTNEERQRCIDAIEQRYGRVISLNGKQIQSLVESVVGEMLVEAPFFGLQIQRDELLRLVRSASGGDLQVKPQELEHFTVTRTVTPPEQAAEALKLRLAAGLQDITSSMMESASIASLSQQTLETLAYSGAFERAMLLLRDRGGQQLVVRLTQGRHLPASTGDLLMPIKPDGQDPLSEALRQHCTCYVANSKTVSLPDWFTHSFAAQSFLLLPLFTGSRLFGCLYADNVSFCEVQALDEQALHLLETLRNLLMMALKPSAPAGGQ